MPKSKDPAPPTNGAIPGAPPGRARRQDAAFDLWLQRGLHRIYDNVAKEPIPDELLRLIEEDRKK